MKTLTYKSLMQKVDSGKASIHAWSDDPREVVADVTFHGRNDVRQDVRVVKIPADVQTAPEWARQALTVILQELQNEGQDLSKLSAEDTLDFVADARPQEMTSEQFEKEVQPAVLTLARKHGLK